MQFFMEEFFLIYNNQLYSYYLLTATVWMFFVYFIKKIDLEVSNNNLSSI